MLETIWQWLLNTVQTICDKLVFLFVSIVGYLSPIEHIAHVVLLFFFIDVIYGWLADRKKTGAKFQPKIVWAKTMPRVLFSIILLVITFLWDEETHQRWIETHLVVGWIINALLLLSILKNGYVVTNWSVIPIIGDALAKKVEKETGSKIMKDEDTD